MKNLTYNLTKGLMYLLSLLPFWVLYRISDLLYLFVFYLIRYRRPLVRKNLRNSFPDKTEKERRRIEKDFYAFFCDYIVETVKILSIPPEKMKRHMEFIGFEQMEDALTRHTSCFLYLGHYCNWEWIASIPLWCRQPDIHFAQLYHPLHSPLFDRLFLELRGRFGSENVRKQDALRHILNYNRNKQKNVVGFISDQTPRWVNIHEWVTFLNQDTPVFIGTERIGKKVDAAIFFCDITRPKRGYYRAVLRPMTEDIRSYPDYELTALYMRELEACIRRAPAFWLWTHNRWKRQRTQ